MFGTYFQTVKSNHLNGSLPNSLHSLGGDKLPIDVCLMMSLALAGAHSVPCNPSWQDLEQNLDQDLSRK